MYRFRSIDALLDKYHELENQEIYFASSSELNDPLEGKMILFWQGDAVVWRNFFIHYLRCLEQVVALVSLKETSVDRLIERIPISIDAKEYPTEAFGLTFSAMTSRFFQNESINTLIALISSPQRRIEQIELGVLLTFIHGYALHAILEVLHEHGYDMLDNGKIFTPTDESFRMLLKALDSLRGTEYPEGDVELIFEVISHAISELGLINAFDRRNHQLSDVIAFLFLDFPAHYLVRIKELVYPDFYVACFMKEATNAKSWGHYGDSHRGACLVFKEHCNTQKKHLPLFYPNIETFQGVVRKADHQYAQVVYQNDFTEVDFFRSLFRYNRHMLLKNWYQSEDGQMSQCTDIFEASFEDQRLAYWDRWQKIAAMKISDWESEGEYRIILSSGFYDFSARENRKLLYDFNDLEGIIFGMNTSTKDKIRIMEVVAAKCIENKRDDFDFYQATYSVRERKMKIDQLLLLKPSVDR